MECSFPEACSLVLRPRRALLEPVTDHSNEAGFAGTPSALDRDGKRRVKIGETFGIGSTTEGALAPLPQRVIGVVE